MQIPFASHSPTGVVWNKDWILFSACNEDTNSELRAFGGLAGKRVFCVSASGGRVLNLLVERPKSVTAVDLNPAQNSLLELKVEAMRELDHEGYLRFMGVRPDSQRAQTYARVRGRLSAAAQQLFDATPEAIERGILFQGNLERYLQRIAVVMRLARPLGLDRLLDARDLDAQRAFMDRLETPLYRAITQTLARRAVLRRFSGDPGFFEYVPEELPLHTWIYARIHGYMRRNLLRDNPLLQLVFFGRYVWEPALPPYLHADTFGAVKAALEETKLEILTTTVEDALRKAGPSAFDAFSLSDISSYLDDDSHRRLFEQVMATAAPGARLCSRSVVHHRSLPSELASRLQRDTALEAELAIDDHACVHEFAVGTFS
jgi:S-adenosylmethionine-diacylglycerol 3-amino-3-carboxypropyl transferase